MNYRINISNIREMLQNLSIILFYVKKTDKLQSDKTLQDLKPIVQLLLTISLLILIDLKWNKTKTLKLHQENQENLQIQITLLDLYLELIDNTLIVQNYKAEKEQIEKNQPKPEQKYLLLLQYSNLLAELM